MMKNEVKVEDSMKTVKERWDLEFPEQASVSMHNLRNNASRFQKEADIRDLILVRNRNKIDRQKDMVKILATIK